MLFTRIRTSSYLICGAVGALVLAAAAPAQAVAISDPTHDFIPSFVDNHDADLDVVTASAVLSGANVILSATMDGAIGSTANALYVWGVNRGAGVAGFGAIAPGVFFDAVIVLNLTPGGNVVSLNGPGGGALGAGAVTISGDDITAVVPLSLLPSTGFQATDYVYNLWPRAPGGGNSHIADFAPNNSSFAASAPEPSAWALLIAGFGLTGAAMRRRRVRAAVA